MGMVVMSKRELNRLDVLARLDSDAFGGRKCSEKASAENESSGQERPDVRRYRTTHAGPRPRHQRNPSAWPNQK
jgi:hypothetical protein